MKRADQAQLLGSPGKRPPRPTEAAFRSGGEELDVASDRSARLLPVERCDSESASLSASYVSSASTCSTLPSQQRAGLQEGPEHATDELGPFVAVGQLLRRVGGWPRSMCRPRMYLPQLAHLVILPSRVRQDLGGRPACGEDGAAHGKEVARPSGQQ